MSFFGNNIRKIRKVKKLSQAAFADLFGLTRASIGAYEEGRAEPKMDTIIAIARQFNLTLDEIITKELTVNDLYKFDIFKEHNIHPAIQKNKQSEPKANTFHLVSDDNFDMRQLSQKDPFHADKIQKFEIPNGLFTGNYLVKVGQHISSKFPFLNVGEWVSFDEVSDIEKAWNQCMNAAVIAVLQKDWHMGFVTGNTKDTVILRATSEESVTSSLPIKEIRFLLRIQSVLHINPLSDKSIHARMDALESQLKEINKKLK